METAKKEVAGYFKMNGVACASDASIDLQLDYYLVCKITDDLGVGRQDGANKMNGYEISDSLQGFGFLLSVLIKASTG